MRERSWAGARGARARRRGRRGARSWFEQDPDRANVAVALDHLRAGRKDDAIATLKACLRINPDNVDALHTLAQAYWGDDQRLSDIEALLRRVTELAPGHVAAWILLGSLLHGADRPEEAIACYQRATELDAGQCRRLVGARCGLRANRRHGEERGSLRAIASPCSPACRAST